MKTFHDLVAWQLAMDLVVETYRECADWPDSERFGLSEQARRAAVSVAANIAEGHGRRSDGEMYRFLSIAHGSLSELKTYFLLAQRLQFSTAQTEARLAAAEEVGRVIGGLMRALGPRRKS